MKASFYTESILYWLVRGTSFLARQFPPGWSVGVGSAAGGLAFHLLPGRRAVGLKNLRAAFGEEYTPQEYHQILKSLFQHLGMTLMEVILVPKMNLAYVEKWITPSPGSRDRVEKALAEGKGVIFLTAHFGNWELSSITGALHGYPMLVLARQQGWPKLNGLLIRHRESKGCRVVGKGFEIRQLIQGLQDKKIIGILSDQDGGRNGVLAPFFGRLASTAPGVMALALKSGAPILPVFMIRQKGPSHLLVVEEPLVFSKEGPLEEQIQRGIASYLELLEKYIRGNPSQWLWLHRRWKSSPQRRVLIFSDGKAGHLAQSKAMAQRVEAAWAKRMESDEGLKEILQPLIQVDVAQIFYKSRFHRACLGLVASLIPKKFRGGDVWLRWGLKPQSYERIRSAYADVSISCGAAAAPAHLLWARAIGSKSIHLNISRWPSWRKFQLAVISRHDWPGHFPSGQGLIVDGALSPLSDSSSRSRWWPDRLGLRKKIRIGLLLGGPARGATLEAQQVKETVSGLLSAAELLDAELLVTTSRRTPLEVEKSLQEIFKHHPRCRLLVLVNHNDSGPLENTGQAVECIFDCSNALVVSGDSISMVSEALAQRKPVVSFLPSETGWSWKPPKYHRFLHQLQDQGRLTLVEPHQVGQTVVEAMNGSEKKWAHPSLNDPVVERLVKWL